MMSAPKSLSSIEQYGPARMRERSRTRISSSGFTTSRLMMRACRGKRFPLQARHANLPVVAGNGYARARRCRLDERSRGYDSGARAGEPTDERLLVEGAAVRDTRIGSADQCARKEFGHRSPDGLSE